MDPRTLFSGRVGRERRDGQRGSLKIESICAAELEIQIRRGTSPARRTFHSIIDTQREREREREGVQRDIRQRGQSLRLSIAREKGRKLERELVWIENDEIFFNSGSLHPRLVLSILSILPIRCLLSIFGHDTPFARSFSSSFCRILPRLSRCEFRCLRDELPRPLLAASRCGEERFRLVEIDTSF